MVITRPANAPSTVTGMVNGCPCLKVAVVAGVPPAAAPMARGAMPPEAAEMMLQAGSIDRTGLLQILADIRREGTFHLGSSLIILMFWKRSENLTLSLASIR